MKKIVVLNGSIRGDEGNSGAFAEQALRYMRMHHSHIQVQVLHLAGSMPSVPQVYSLLEEADGFLVISGVYWNSWGSPLQRFIEVATAFENSPAFFGKPIACAISMDSVGGSDVAARLQAAFAGLGCWSSPCSTLVVSRVGLEAIQKTKGTVDDPNEDVWRPSDLEIVLDNLAQAVAIDRSLWKAWPHVELDVPRGEWPTGGLLDLGAPKFIP